MPAVSVDPLLCGQMSVFANYLNLATPKKTKGWSPRLREGIISGHRDMT